MSDKKDRTFVGDGKQVSGYPLVNLNICLTDISKDFIRKGKNGKLYVDLTVGERRNGADNYGNTHSIWINDYKPEQKQEVAVKEDVLPF